MTVTILRIQNRSPEASTRSPAALYIAKHETEEYWGKRTGCLVGDVRAAACAPKASRLLRLASNDARSSANDERRDCVVDVRRESRAPTDVRSLSPLARTFSPWR